MSSTWFFNSPTPGRTRESQVEKFFKAEGERADPIVREGIQNSLDAGNNNSVVRIRLTLGRWTPSVTAKKWPRYSDTLNPHLGAVADEIAQPSLDEDFRFLVFEDFEDFETSGLEGPPEQWLVDKHKKNAFFDFFRAEGVSHKAGGDRGRHGVGKFVFLGASRIRTIFGLTRRNDQRELLMATTVLRHHTLRSKPYLPDGWFGLPEDNGNVLPLEDEGDAIARFKKDFQLTRDGECGLSIVVPWLVEDINAEKLIRSVVEGYFLPLICNQLVVEVVDEGGQGERIDYLTIRDVVAAQGDEYALSMQVRLDLAASFARSKTPLLLAMPPGGHTAPQWGEGCIPTEVLCTIRAKLSAGDWIHLECPTRVRRKNERVANPDQFQLYFQRPAGQTHSEIYFIRQGILVSGVRIRREPGLRGLAVIDDGVLAKFLGDAESPAHTEWLSEYLAKDYSFHQATLKYVVESFNKILALAKENQTAPDPLLMIDLFHETDDDETAPKVKPKKKAGGKPNDPPPPPPPSPKWYRLQQLENGFAVLPGEGSRPESCTIRMAYDTEKGDAFKKYHPADFRLDRRDEIHVDPQGFQITTRAKNRIAADLTQDDFKLVVTGFDPNRDVVVEVRKGTAREDQPEEEDADAEEV